MPSYTITAPNGKSYTVEGPAGATKEQVIAEVVRRDPGAAQAPRKRERSVGDYLSMGGRAIMGGIGDTVASAYRGNPVTLIAEKADDLGRYITGRPKRMPMADAVMASAEGGANKLGLAKPETTGERLASAGIRGATGAVIGGGGGGLASAATNLAAGAASGVTAEATKDMPWYVSVPASMAAGVAVGATPSLLKNAAGAVISRSQLDPSKGMESAARNMQHHTDDAASALAAIDNRPTPTRGTAPTLPEVTGDRAHAAMARERMSNPIQAQMDTNAQGRMGAIDNAMGDGSTAALPKLADDITSRNQYALDRAHGRVGSANPVDRGQSGSDIRDTFKAEYESAKARTRAEYEHPILKAQQPVVIGRSFLDKIRDTLERYYGEGGGLASPKTREVLGDLMDHMDDQPATGTFNTNSSVVTNIDQRLADIAGRAKVSGARKEASAAQALRVDLGNHVADQLPVEFTEQLKIARAARLDQGRRFEQGKLGRALGEKLYGEAKVSDIELPGRLVQPGPAGGSIAEQLVKAVGPKASETAVRQEIARRVAEGKLSTPAQLTGIDEVLKRFPGLKDDVENLRAQAALNDVFSKSHLGQMGDLSKSPSARVADLLRAKDEGVAFKELTDQVINSGDEAALAGLRKTLSDYAMDVSEGARVSADGVKIPDNAKALDAVTRILDRGGDALTSEQRTVFEQLKREYGRTQFAKTGGVAQEGVGQHNIPFVQGWQARTLKFMNEHFGNKKRIDALLERAILDPDFAAELLKRPTPDRLAKLKRTLGRATRASALGANAGPVPEESK